MSSLVTETDPNGKSPHEPGSKLDGGKPCLWRGFINYFPRAITEVAAVSTFGAEKYTWGGWETVPHGHERYSDAMIRHLTKESSGEVLDSDSGFSHAAHAAWNALARLELTLKDKENLMVWESSRDAQDIINSINSNWYLQPSKEQS